MVNKPGQTPSLNKKTAQHIMNGTNGSNYKKNNKL